MITLVSWILLTIGCLVVISNWRIPVMYYYSRKSGSIIPLIGGVVLMAGFFLSDYSLLQRCFWLPLIIDVGSLPIMLMLIWRLIKKS
jgi:hypothetical protein